MSFGPTELIIILVIVLLLFGVGRVSKIGGELGSAVANFRKGLDDGSKKPAEVTPPVDASSTPVEPK
ncbi:MAG TPA: twin-arginine translocase TatA/TatE family subunit [Candidatus Limnocylindrales bacterium]|jgi:sec-independent protein translocase protein TatA|nr:twin-arginine translocase TatA/TatE family subunit [Candidatus Limnocylindrales bacterium]